MCSTSNILKHQRTSSPTWLALLRRKTAALINHFQQEHIFRLVCWDHIKNVKHFVAACKQQLQLQQLPVNQFAVGREEEAVVISPKLQSGQAGLLHVKGGSENTTDSASDMEAHCAHLTERRMPFAQEAGKITTGGWKNEWINRVTLQELRTKSFHPHLDLLSSPLLCNMLQSGNASGNNSLHPSHSSFSHSSPCFGRWIYLHLPYLFAFLVLCHYSFLIPTQCRAARKKPQSARSGRADDPRAATAGCV